MGNNALGKTFMLLKQITQKYRMSGKPHTGVKNFSFWKVQMKVNNALHCFSIIKKS